MRELKFRAWDGEFMIEWANLWEGVTIVGKPKDLLRLIHSGKLSIFEKEDK